MLKSTGNLSHPALGPANLGQEREQVGIKYSILSIGEGPWNADGDPETFHAVYTNDQNQNATQKIFLWLFSRKIIPRKMLSNPLSRPTRTIFLFIIFLVAGTYFYRPVHELPHNFPRFDTETLHQYLNRSDHAQKPLAFMSKLHKQLHHAVCVPDSDIARPTRHHYRTETETKTITSTTTKTSLIQPTCDAIVNAPKLSKEDATPEQLTIAKLRDEGIIIIFKTGA